MGDGAKAAASAWPAVQTLPKSSPSSITSQWPPSGVESGGPRSQRPLQGERALGWVRGSGVQVWSLSIPAHHLSPETAWRHFPVRWWLHTNLRRQSAAVLAGLWTQGSQSLDSPPTQSSPVRLLPHPLGTQSLSSFPSMRCQPRRPLRQQEVQGKGGSQAPRTPQHPLQPPLTWKSPQTTADGALMVA